MLVTILVHHPITVSDSPTYTSVGAGGAPVAAAETDPPELGFEHADVDTADIEAQLEIQRQNQGD